MPSYLSGRSFFAACLFAAVAVSSANADSFDAIYTFGDSLSDAGNAYLASGGTIPGAPYSNGRFSNGNVWVQDVAAAYGLPAAATPSLAGGTDYAVGGALSGSANPGDLLTPVNGQLAAYQAAHPIGDPNGLYMIWIGSDDLRAILAGSPTSLASVIGNIDFAITSLASTGAKNFLVVTAPDLGKTPEAIATGPVGVAAATGLSSLFDTGLAGSVNGLAAADGLNLKVLDAFGLLDSITANPGAYGLTDATDPCLIGEVNYSGGTACANPNQYLFWDQIHPTAAGQAIVAQAALQAVPEPGALTLMLGAMSALGVVVVRKRRSDLLN
jgi:outer membrane lipase/esterase